MKPWVVIVLILFIAVTGYQFGFYHGKLASSNVEKERLNTVLERSRTTASSNLRVIKATPQMSGEAHGQTSDGAHTLATNEPLSDLQVQNEITEFLAFHPSGQKLTLNTFECTQSECEFTGEYSGSHAGFKRMLNDLKAQSWWHFGEILEVSNIEEGNPQIGVKFSSRPVLISDATT
ncbi:hypothetical protein [uncultured Alteromonas sp.]|jgi:hypothetical protein|uniref:hypothetical protein n=1 Tax=uncultured Alteromonas sp. TaxID=179113 RepID=UPI000C3AADAD|nr:hypothetical protein [uncultured Alteromonas sp.]MBB68254.1 hypothetical protein [Rickettsiales bacterium]|tara:strand:- start:2956 stop:3486 length:531 start_codon:yes stop_codon:yes gene_type:complete